MLTAIRMWLFGRRCKTHDVWFQSDFCPQCVRRMAYMIETHDLVYREPGHHDPVIRA